MLHKKMKLLMHIKGYIYLGPLQLILTVDTVRAYVLEAIKQETWKHTITLELFSWKQSILYL